MQRLVFHTINASDHFEVPKSCVPWVSPFLILINQPHHHHHTVITSLSEEVFIFEIDEYISVSGARYSTTQY